MISPGNKIAPLNGLVLAGGKSKRMGSDKGRIRWHGKEQCYYAADLLQKYCETVFISCRPDQAGGFDPGYQVLPDRFQHAGPCGGILTAFASGRDHAWLVVACDLPLLDEATIEFLVQHRNAAAIATTFESPYDGLPEPLITIWEPGSHPILRDYWEKGMTCPRKILINSKKTILQPPHPEALMNVNTPEDAEKARQILSDENSAGFERYRCQMALPNFGKKAQQLLQEARVLIVGAGGLGCPAAQYLAAAGVGTIGIADDDLISTSNLHRQILFTPGDIGLKKVKVAAEKLQRQNPFVKILPHDIRVGSSNVTELISAFDLVIDGTDNFEAKYLLNDACVLGNKPLIYGAIYQYEGQMGVLNVLLKDGTRSPNYRDIFPGAEKAQVANCAEGGVIPTLAGIIGCMQANEAIKYFTGREKLLAGKLWMIDVQSGKTRIIDLKKNPSVKIPELAETIGTVTLSELQHDLQQTQYELIDVRSKEEHRAFNIGGKNIPLSELEDHLEGFSSSGPIICYCASGNRSAAAARLIKNRWPEVAVYSLKGGIEKLKISHPQA